MKKEDILDLVYTKEELEDIKAALLLKKDPVEPCLGKSGNEEIEDHSYGPLKLSEDGTRYEQVCMECGHTRSISIEEKEEELLKLKTEVFAWKLLSFFKECIEKYGVEGAYLVYKKFVVGLESGQIDIDRVLSKENLLRSWKLNESDASEKEEENTQSRTGR